MSDKVPVNASTEGTTPPPLPPTIPREDLIHTAVRFLSDPSVANAPLAKRIAFLESKGLKSFEIEQALSRSSQSRAPHDYSPSQFSLTQSTMMAMVPCEQQSVAGRWRRWLAWLALFGGIGYAAYTYLLKKHIEKLLLGSIAKYRALWGLVQKPPSQSEVDEDGDGGETTGESTRKTKGASNSSFVVMNHLDKLQHSIERMDQRWQQAIDSMQQALIDVVASVRRAGNGSVLANALPTEARDTVRLGNHPPLVLKSVGGLVAESDNILEEAFSC